MGGKADPQAVAVVVTIDALTARIATLEAQVRAVTSELELGRHRHHLVGHEVRTPLTVILGVLATLQHPDVTGAERRRLEARALAQARRMREVVDDLMAGDTPVRKLLPRSELETVPLAPLLRTACAAVAHGHLVLDVHDDLLIATAPARLRTIVSTLVDNATTHGNGHVEVGASSVDHVVVITVADRGPGLRGADPEELFAPFTRGPGSEHAQGWGIGLYLVRLVSRTLGGDVTIRDREPGGLVATVRLPQRRSEDPVFLGDRRTATPAPPKTTAPPPPPARRAGRHRAGAR